MIKALFNKKDYSTPAQDDFRITEVVVDGIPQLVKVPFDFNSFDSGHIEDWSFERMLKAGITPPVMGDFNSNQTRLESSAEFDSFVIESNNILTTE